MLRQKVFLMTWLRLENFAVGRSHHPWRCPMLTGEIIEDAFGAPDPKSYVGFSSECRRFLRRSSWVLTTFPPSFCRSGCESFYCRKNVIIGSSRVRTEVPQENFGGTQVATDAFIISDQVSSSTYWEVDEDIRVDAVRHR